MGGAVLDVFPVWSKMLRGFPCLSQMKTLTMLGHERAMKLAKNAANFVSGSHKRSSCRSPEARSHRDKQSNSDTVLVLATTHLRLILQEM